MATSSTQDRYVALELSRAKWLVGAFLPGRSKVTTALVPGGDTAALLDVLTHLAARATRDSGAPVVLKVCYEGGYDGFWLARFLIGNGIETHVLDPASVWARSTTMTAAAFRNAPVVRIDRPRGAAVHVHDADVVGGPVRQRGRSATLPPGWASCLGRRQRVARRGCSASRSRATSYLRTLVIHGARAALPSPAAIQSPMGEWVRCTRSS